MKFRNADALAAAAAVALPWFLSGGFLFFTDFVWGAHPDLGLWKNGYPALLFMRALGFVLPASLVQKLFVAAVLALLFFAGKRLAAALAEDRRVGSLVGLFFLFNPFIYDRLGYGQLFMMLGLALFALGAADLIKGPILRAGLWFGLAVQFSPHFVFFIVLLGAAWLAARVIEKEAGRKLFVSLGLAALIAGALNANWLLGAFAASRGQATRISSYEEGDFDAFRTSGRDRGEAVANVLMMSGFWGKDQYRYHDLTRFRENWGRSFFLLLPIILLGAHVLLCDRKQRAFAAGLLAVFALSAFLAVGVRSDSGRAATLWLHENVPFYGGLRETQKWVAVLTLVYAVFLSAGLDRLFRIRFVSANRAAAALFLAGALVMQSPFMLWGMSGSVRPRPYPPDWRRADALVSEGGCRGKILFLPWHLYMHFKWIGGVVAVPANAHFRCPVLKNLDMEWGGVNAYADDPEQSAVRAWLASEGSADLSLPGEDAVSHVVLAKEADWRAYGWLDGHHALKLVLEGETLNVYEVVKSPGEAR